MPKTANEWRARPSMRRDPQGYVPVAERGPDSKLKPCPFDGGTRLVVVRTPRFMGAPEPDEDDFYAYNVHCTSCACDGPWKKSQSSAEFIWNGLPGTERGGPL